MFQHSFSVWKSADEPNYSTNFELLYPYSGFPYEGHYNLVKIPVPPKNFIQHVDYWGEGRVVSGDGISGFPNSYNVNHQYRLVSSGADRDKKIPNRIPLFEYTFCDTRAYIEDNSVLTVTVSAARMNSSCAKDIARIVNDEHGKVVVYRRHGDSQEISELVNELKIKGLSPLEDANLPSELQGLTYFHSHLVFEKSSKVEEIKMETLKENLLNHIDTGNLDAAVHLSKNVGEFVSEVVTKLTSSAPDKVMLYAYKLWHAGRRDLVRKYFPKPYELVINRDFVNIFNKQYGLFIRRHVPITTLDWSKDVYTMRAESPTAIRSWHQSRKWKFYPTYDGRDGLAFLIVTHFNNMCIRMVGDTAGEDANCWVTTISEIFSDDKGYKFLLEPSVGDDGNLYFTIINVDYKQGLKCDSEENNNNRGIRGHNGNIHDKNDNCKWIIKKDFDSN